MYFVITVIVWVITLAQMLCTESSHRRKLYFVLGVELSVLMTLLMPI